MTNKKEHLYLLDILKIMTLVSIAIFHANEFVFWEDILVHARSSPIFYYCSFFTRFIGLGGQFLVTLIYFLFGFSGKSKKSLATIAAFAFLGQTLLALVQWELEWDIYAYIAVANLLIISLPFFFNFRLPVLIISFLFLWVPTSFFQNLLPPDPFWVIFTGQMSWYNSGSWPLLPWFFLALMNYQLGIFVRDHREEFRKIHKFEIWAWPLVLLMSLPHIGFFFKTPAGPTFYFFSFNQLPWIYWSNMTIFILLMRMSFLDSVQAKINHISFVKWISNLYWIRHLGLTYLISIIYLGMGFHLRETFKTNPALFDLFFIGIMPVSELLSRGLVKIKKLSLSRVQQ